MKPKTRLAPLVVLLSASLLAHPAPAQDLPPAPAPTGRIAGRVLEESTGAPIAGAQVGVVGTRIGGVSGVDGRFTLLNVPAGTVSLGVRNIGYQPKTVEGLVVRPGAVTVQDVALTGTTVQLGEITVAAAIERGTVTAALEAQRDAVNIVSGVTAEEIARSPDSDAGQAIQRVSGVTVQDGRYVLVRGLGERYTTTSLNSARLPSPEPERKVVPLDLFPASLLEGVQTSKTFTPDQPGDFSGAQVNLRTREFYEGRVLTWSLSAGYNSNATFRDLPSAPRTGSEWAGLPGAAREIPEPVEAAGNLSGQPASAIPGLIGSFRNVWSAEAASPAPNLSASFSVGGEDPVLGRLFGYLVSATYQTSTETREHEVRALGVADGAGGARPQNAYTGRTVTNSVLWGGILNLSTRVGSGSKLSFNNTYNRSGDNGVVRAGGHNEEFDRDFDITRLQYVARSVRSNQLAGEHLVTGRHQVTWAVTSSGVTRDEPDRSDLAYEGTLDSATGVVVPRQWFGGPRTGNRTFSDLSESAWQGDLALRLTLGSRSSLKVGGQYRTTDRAADTRSYDIVNFTQSDSQLARAPELVFADTTQLGLVANANGGRYDAADRLWAGFAQAEVPLGRRVRIIGGLRMEHSDVQVDTRTTDGTVYRATPVTTDVLPALALTWEFARSHQLRLSATQTLSRPEYRELSGVCYFEILGGATVCGNANLRRALIQNLDARWEWYPAAGEVVSIGAFAKHFDQPIERVLVGTTGATTASFVNADGAFNYGLELELRKGLGALAAPLLPFSLFVNATLMRSEIDISSAAGSVSALTNGQRPMVGQSPYVVNAGLAYTSPAGRFAGTVLYNVVGRRIYEAGTLPLPDTYEEARSLLDVALRYQFSRTVSAKVDVKNLLDAPYRLTQGAVVRHGYTVGRTTTIGFSWEP
jgi:outer membrane receptor for ferrienterochelin and colicin